MFEQIPIKLLTSRSAFNILQVIWTLGVQFHDDQILRTRDLEINHSCLQFKVNQSILEIVGNLIGICRNGTIYVWVAHKNLSYDIVSLKHINVVRCCTPSQVSQQKRRAPQR